MCGLRCRPAPYKTTIVNQIADRAIRHHPGTSCGESKPPNAIPFHSHSHPLPLWLPQHRTPPGAAHHPRAVRPSLPARGGTHVVPLVPSALPRWGPYPDGTPRSTRTCKGMWTGGAGVARTVLVTVSLDAAVPVARRADDLGQEGPRGVRLMPTRPAAQCRCLCLPRCCSRSSEPAARGVPPMRQG